MEHILQALAGKDPSISAFVALTVLVISSLLCGFVALTYRICHRGVSYSSGFAHTLILMGMVVSAIIMIVGTDLARAFSLVGALSVIRYRTAVKDPKDTGYMFLALAIGMAVGAQFYLVAFIMTVFVSLAMLILSRIQFIKPLTMPLVLTIHYALNVQDATSEIEGLLEKETANWRLLLHEGMAGTRTVTSTYQVQLKQKAVSQLTKTIKQLAGVERIVIFDEAHSMQV